MDKEDFEYSGILLSHKKMDENSTITKDMDRPKYCHTEWSKSKRKNKYTCHLCVESRKVVSMNLFVKQK